jgi:CO/xanthine dehydrogenase Mo-binding subunit
MTPPPVPKSLKDYPLISDWLEFKTDGRATLRSGKVEIGQGIATALVQIAADELDIDPARIDLVAGDTRSSPDEGFTAGSMSIQMSGGSIRLAASAARQLLLAEAANLLQAKPGGLEIEDGQIHNSGQDSGLTLWGLAEKTDLAVPAEDYAAPKPTETRRLIGTAMARLDLPDKVTGRPAFIHDLEFEDMLHGRILHPPAPSAEIKALDEAALKDHPDIAGMVRNGSFIGIVAEREDAALRGLAALEAAVTWGPAAQAPADPVVFLKATTGDEQISVEKGSLDGLDGKTYETAVSRPYLAHGSIGTCCAIAQWQSNHLTVHTHSQGVYQLREGLMMALDLNDDDITLIHVPGAGCYGHNGADDAAFDAALLAMAQPGRPVRVVWSRASELASSPLGPAMVTRAKAIVDDNNRITGFRTDVTSQIHGRRPGRGSSNLLAAEFMDPPRPSTWRKDVPLASGGGADRNAAPYYAIANIRSAKWLVHDLPYRASSLRGLGAIVNVFAIETLMDDMAADLAIDPVNFRLDHLDDERARAVVEKTAEMAGWPGEAEDNAGLGFGFARYKNTSAYCAVCARIELEDDIRVSHIWAAVEAGEAINPDGIANQIEGGIVQAMSWTLKEQVTVHEGAVTSRDWEAYPIVRFDEVPAMKVAIIDRPDQPSLGAGECTMGPTAAAIGNGIFRAFGVRLKDLPLTRDKIIAAIG